MGRVGVLMKTPTIALALLTAQLHTGLAQQPPLIPLDSAPFSKKALSARNVSWIRSDAPFSEVYVKRGSRAELVIPTLASHIGEAVASDLKLLGERAPDRSMRLFFVGSR